jgi:hypothetical protein
VRGGANELIISARKSAGQVVVCYACGMQALLYRRGGGRALRGWLVASMVGGAGMLAGVAGKPGVLAVRLGLKQCLTGLIN